MPSHAAEIVRTLCGEAAFSIELCAQALGLSEDAVRRVLEHPRVQTILAHYATKVASNPQWTRRELQAFATISFSDFLERGDDGQWRISLDKAMASGALPYLKRCAITLKDGEQRLDIELYDRFEALKVLARSQGVMNEPSTSTQIQVNFVSVEEASKSALAPSAGAAIVDCGQ